jgi:hypothetical protein
MAIVFRPPQRRIIPSSGFGGALKIDWSHPIANGIVAAFVPGVSGVIDLCGGLTLAQGTAATFDAASEGPAMSHAAAGTGPFGTVPSGHALRSWAKLSYYWRGAVGASLGATANARLIGVNYDSVSTSPFITAALYLDNGSPTNPNTWKAAWNAGGSFSIATNHSAISVTAGAVFSAAATYNQSGNVKSYSNGLLFDTTAWGAGAPTYGSAPQFCLGSDPSSLSAGLKVFVAFAWNRELGAEEIAALDADPYCFLISAEAELPLLYAPPTQFSGTNAVNPQNWKLLPRNPGRLPDGVLRGLTGRWPLDDSSNDNVVRDVVGSTYLIKDSQAPLLAAGPVPGSRGLQFGVDSAGSPNSNNELNWLTSPIPQTGWTGTCSFWTWLDAINSVDGFTARHIALGTTTPFCTSYNSNSFQFEYGGGNQFATTAFGVATGRWYHVCIVFTGSACTFYINGVADASLGTFDGSSPARAGVYSVGGRGLTVGGGGGADRTLAGRILDIRFYTGTLLTPAEVSQLYNSAFEVPEVMPSLYLAAATGFIPAWARGSNLPIIGGGHI